MVGAPVASFFGPEGLDTRGCPGPVERECLVRPVSGRGPLRGGMTRTDRGTGAAEVPDPGSGKARGVEEPAAQRRPGWGAGAAPSGLMRAGWWLGVDGCARIGGQSGGARVRNVAAVRPSLSTVGRWPGVLERGEVGVARIDGAVAVVAGGVRGGPGGPGGSSPAGGGRGPGTVLSGWMSVADRSDDGASSEPVTGFHDEAGVGGLARRCGQRSGARGLTWIREGVRCAIAFRSGTGGLRVGRRGGCSVELGVELVGGGGQQIQSAV